MQNLKDRAFKNPLVREEYDLLEIEFAQYSAFFESNKEDTMSKERIWKKILIKLLDLDSID